MFDGNCADELQIVEPTKTCAELEIVPFGNNDITCPDEEMTPVGNCAEELHTADPTNI